MTEQDIEYENGPVWTLKDVPNRCFTVYVAQGTHSVADSSYPLTDDGRSLAVARVDYLSKRKRIP